MVDGSVRRRSGQVAALAGVTALALLLGAPATRVAGQTSGPASTGAWSAAFEEDPGNRTFNVPADSANPRSSTEHCFKTKDASGNDYLVCKPTAVSAVALPDGRVLYWNGLEGWENIKTTDVIEDGAASRNSQSRLLDMRTGQPVFGVPTPSNGCGNDPKLCNPDSGTGPPFPLPGSTGANPNNAAQGDMFCSDQVHLADGRVLVVGGSAWYNDPALAGNYGAGDLTGLRTTRVFDPATDHFTLATPMNHARWYPALIELADGRVFAGGGVRKLIKTDGINVRQTEVFDPRATTNGTFGTWTDNGLAGETGLPLFPRMHLLPDGTVYYTGVGQMWSPFGQSIDEASYAAHEVWNPKIDAWSTVGLGLVGARSGAFSAMLTLRPPYRHADILIGGGTVGPPPGSYFADNITEVDSYDAKGGWSFSMGPNLQHNRWFSTSVILPNDAVAVFSGGDRDEVISPGSEHAVRTAEWYTPWDKQFHDLSADNRERTYHNTALLLPDGSILVGGHSPFGGGYGKQDNSNHDNPVLGGANQFKDPSFEIYRPPYLFKGPRPTIDQVQSRIAYGTSFTLQTPDATRVTSIRLIRLGALTHVTDGNMRSVDLPFTVEGRGTLRITAPPHAAVAPPGPYYLFINTGRNADTIPSSAAIVSVGSTENHQAARIPWRAASGIVAAGSQLGAEVQQQQGPATVAGLPNTTASTLSPGRAVSAGLLGAAMIAGRRARRSRRRSG